jgi:excisionase family DNA binding protein
MGRSGPKNRPQQRLETLLKTQDVADILGVPLSTVHRWNSERSGPRYFKVGKHCRYRVADLDEWISRRAVEPHSAA